MVEEEEEDVGFYSSKGDFANFEVGVSKPPVLQRVLVAQFGADDGGVRGAPSSGIRRRWSMTAREGAAKATASGGGAKRSSWDCSEARRRGHFSETRHPTDFIGNLVGSF